MKKALADYVNIINSIIKEYNLPSDIPVIAFGGSYPGELAAFLRIAYPNVPFLSFSIKYLFSLLLIIHYYFYSTLVIYSQIFIIS